MRLGPFTGGLNTHALPLVGAMTDLQDLRDVRMDRGAIEGRNGFRMLGREPSWKNGGGGKATVLLTFNAAGFNDGVASFTGRLGKQWTVRAECTFALAANAIAGFYPLLTIQDGALNQILYLYAEGMGAGTLRIGLTLRDKNGVVLGPLVSATQTVAAWQAIAASRFIRITRDNATVNVYAGNSNIITSAGFTTAEHATAAFAFLCNDAFGVYGNAQWSGLTIANRVLTEAECYFRISYPTDPDKNEQQILGNWPMHEATGSSLRDFSAGAANFTLRAGPAWSGGAVAISRCLGLHTFRRRSGQTYYMVGFTRTGTSGSGASPSGVVWAWRNTDSFYPFYWNGNPDAVDATAPDSQSGLDPLARIQFLTCGDIELILNGKDYGRKFNGTSFRYYGGTAPSTAPRGTLVGGGALTGTYKYAVTFYNSTDLFETGLSPILTIAPAAQNVSLQWYLSTDPQFDKVRIYRTVAGGDEWILLGETTMASPAFVDSFTDAVMQNNGTINERGKRPYLQSGPPAAPAVAVGGAGVLAGNYRYATSWYDPLTGVETGLSPESALVAPAGQSVNVTYAIPSNPAFSVLRVYRTTAGGITWFRVADVTWANPPVAYNDNAADNALLEALLEKNLPPKCKYAVLFGNRVWMAGDPANPSTVYWSTAGDYENVPVTNAHTPNAGSDVTGLYATEGALFVHYRDGSIYVMPNPGGATLIQALVVTTMRQFSPIGATVAHFSQQDTDIGPVWLGCDGFYLLTEGAPVRISRKIDEAMSTLNARRAQYACSVFDEAEHVYRCWLSRGTNRLNDECFVFQTEDRTWDIDQYHADAAGILLDVQEVKHYVIGSEMGWLAELYAINADGDGSGTLAGTVAGASFVQFTDIVGRVAPAGGDGGYPVWFEDQTTGAAHQRYIDSTVGPLAGKAFYPSLSDLQNGNVWKVYFHGIRSRFRTMQTDLAHPRESKNLVSLFFSFVKKASGALKTYLYRNGGAAAAQVSVDMTKPFVHEVQVSVGEGRVFEIEAIHTPPNAGEAWSVTTVEAVFHLGKDTP